MTDRWIGITIPLRGGDPDEIAGSVAYDCDCIVETSQEEDGSPFLKLWLPADQTGPERMNHIVGLIRAEFPDVAVGDPRAEEVPDRDWLEEWKKSFKPLPVGSRLVVVPPWLAPEEVPGRETVVIDPGMAFGTGHHPTTEMCLRFIERHAPATLLDVGTGTGILALAAARLGAGRVVGVETDPAAVAIARENVHLNRLDGRIDVIEGSADAVEGEFAMVTANLFLAPLVRLAALLAVRVAPGGVLVISGVTLEQAERAERAMAEAGLAVQERIEQDRWAAAAFVRAG